MNKLLNEKETASYLGISRTTLAQSRMAKTKAKLPAPPFIRLGRTIRYVKEDLDKWIERHKVAHVKPKRLQKPVSVLGKKFELSVTRKARRAPKVRQQQLPYLNG